MAELIFLGKGVAIKDSKTLLIDCGLGIGERIEQEGLEPDALVLTSRRPATCEGLGGLLERFPGLPVIEGKSIKKRGKKVNLGDIEARPFKVQQVRGIDAYGWRIKAGGKTLIYAPDSPNMSEKFLKGVDLAVLDTIRMDDSSFKVYDGLRIDLDDPKAAFKAISYEDLVNAHTLIMEEMEGRGVEHNIRDRLDRDSTKLEKHKKVDKKLLKRLRKMEDVLLIPSYVSIVGSSLKGKKEADIDWLFREESRNRNESHELALLKQFGRDAGYEHHFIYNPQGAHADYLPVYDLVLRKKKELKIRSEKALDVLRIDLGSGGDSPEGYIGIDKREGAQIVHDLERGIPFGSSVVDEVRAWHFLEHHSNPQLIMEEIWRVLKPGGTFVFEVPSTEGPGAFADPTHKSYWNRLSFLYYVQDGLREYLGTPAKFEIVEMEERKDPEFGTVYVRGRLRALKEREVTKAKKVEPFGRFTPPKPRMAFYTEFFSAEELYEKWAKERLEEGIDLEEKLNGFRTLLQKRGDRVDIWFEDAKKSKVKQLPDLAKQLAKIPDDFILDASVGINRNGKPLPRISLMTLTAKKPKLGPDDVVVATVFDLPYWKEDLHERPLSERRKLLEQFYNRYLKTKNFALTSYNVVKSKGKLLSVAKRLAKVPGSEGCVAKTLDSEWSPTGATPDWAKIKTVLEIKVIVLDKTTNRAGSYNYNCGVLLGDTKFENVVDYKGKKIVKLGKTFNTSINASEGDVLTVEVEEIIVDEKRLVWLGPTVVDVDKARKEPYYAGQIVDLARRAGSVLQEVKAKKGTVGLYLVQPHARWLAQGKKKLIIKSKPHRKYLNRRILVVSEGKAWALIVLKSVKPISLKEFRKRRKEHLISEDERKRWWPGKKTLYAFEFVKVATLDPPKKVDVERGVQVWIRDVPIEREKEQVSPEDAFGICGEGVDEKVVEDEPRAEVARRFWKANWFKSFPKSGKGKFVYHHHFRGLLEEEKDKSEEALLETKHSIHGDLRFSFDDALWGFSVFLGKTEDVRKGRDLHTLPKDDALQGQFKLHQPCLAEETPVWTDRGIIPAREVRTGDKVLNRYGRFEDCYVSYHPSQEPMIAIRTVLGWEQIVSANHPYLKLVGVKPREKNRISEWSKDGKRLIWCEAKNLQVGDLIAFPKPRFPLSHFRFESFEWGKLFGAILGDGHIPPKGQGSVTICFGKDGRKAKEYQSLADDLGFDAKIWIFKGQFHLKLYRPSTRRDYDFKYRLLNDWKFYHGGEKDFPIQWLNKPKKFRRGLLEGLADSDGYRRDGVWYFCSTSRRLMGKAVLLAMTLGYLPYVRKKSYSNGWKDYWEMRIQPKRKTFHYREDRDYWYLPVRNIDYRPSEGEVINIATPDTGTLCLPHSITHNTGWLRVEGVSEPGGVGATAEKYAKFFIVDSGTYEMGVWREHFFEVFLHGKKLKGRYLIAFAPVGEGGRKWLIKKPEDQRPYADTHDKEKVIKELRGKGQRYLVWAKPGMKPELIDVKGKAVAQQFLKKLARKALEPGFGVTKVEGEPRWWAVSSTTHEDLEGEVITRKALEIAHRLGVQEGFGPLLYEHVPKARIGECDGQLLVGDYLLETGTFSPDEKGQKGLKALSEAPPGRYKVSIGYYYWPWSKVGNKYKAIRIFERSATTKAANPFTSFEILRKERKVLSDSQIAALKEIFEIDDDEVQEWLEDEGEESVLKVLKAFESEEGVEEKKKRKPKKGEEEEEDEEKKKKKPPKKDEEEYPEKEKAGKAETALRGIAKLLKSIEPEKVRSKVAKLLSKAGLDLAKYGYGKYEYGTPAKKALEDLAKEVKSLKSIMMERDANLETIVDGLIEATKEGKVEALETFKTLLKEKSVEGAREPDEEKELSDEEKEIVEVAKKALKEVLEEQSSFDALYKHPRFQSLEK